MTDTLKSIKKAADIDIVATSNGDAPEGHFVATTKVLGLTTTYLLNGELDDEDAVIVGRVEIIEKPNKANSYRTNAYRGSRIKGGELISAGSYDEAWTKMV
ncbi:MAG: hypothetical protein H9W81_07770 [Enterococcus sp.]|nr:hypothetical protein [Enterococcus sp.]